MIFIGTFMQCGDEMYTRSLETIYNTIEQICWQSYHQLFDADADVRKIIAINLYFKINSWGKYLWKELYALSTENEKQCMLKMDAMNFVIGFRYIEDQPFLLELSYTDLLIYPNLHKLWVI